MITNRLNLNHIRVFEAVYRHRNISKAALELHLTQSGVSQHLKAFEGQLGILLFDRLKQKLIPTDPAKMLYEQSSNSLQGLEKVLRSITEKGSKAQEISGSVCVGVPIEFGNNVLLPILSQFLKDHSHVHIEIRMGFASAMNRLLLQGELDFAFVDEFPMNPIVEVQSVYDEFLELCVHPKLMKGRRTDLKALLTLPYVEYQRGAPILRSWFRHHFKTQNFDLNIRATVMDVQGVARLIAQGVGAGIVPRHLIGTLSKASEKFQIIKGSGKPLVNHIGIATLKNRTLSHAAEKTLQTISSAFPPN